MQLLGPFDAKAQFVSAVSGGADSLALTLLASQWAQKNGFSFQAVSVDHGLRSESANECQQVHSWLQKHGIRHTILKWNSAHVTSRLQEKAREARYKLIGEWCYQNHVTHVLLGHHFDDQIETYLMRYNKGSDFEGLAGMSAEIVRNGVRYLRPLLATRKNNLKDVLRELGQSEWVEDPSNQNPHFDRVALRQQIQQFSTEKITRIQENIIKNQQRRVEWELRINNHVNHLVTLDNFGVAHCDKTLFQLPEEQGKAVLQRCLMTVGGFEYPPRRSKTKAIYETLRHQQFHQTCHGCLFVEKGSTIQIIREMGKSNVAQKINKERFIWDHRFEYCGQCLPEHSLDFLTEKGWQQIVASCPTLKDATITRKALYSLPAIWSRNHVICVPHLNYQSAKGQGIRDQFQLNLLPRYPLSRRFKCIYR